VCGGKDIAWHGATTDIGWRHKARRCHALSQCSRVIAGSVWGETGGKNLSRKERSVPGGRIKGKIHLKYWGGTNRG